MYTITQKGKIMKAIYSERAPNPIGPFSQAYLANGFLFVSGQGDIDPTTNEIVKGGIQAQAEQTCKNIATLLTAAKTDFSKVVKANCYLANMDDFVQFNEVYEKYFISRPARTCVAVKKLPMGIACEIEVIACL